MLKIYTTNDRLSGVSCMLIVFNLNCTYFCSLQHIPTCMYLGWTVVMLLNSQKIKALYVSDYDYSLTDRATIYKCHG